MMLEDEWPPDGEEDSSLWEMPEIWEILRLLTTVGAIIVAILGGIFLVAGIMR